MLPRLLSRCLLLLSLLASMGLHAAELKHNTWDQLLKKHLLELNKGSVTQLNYEGMAKDRQQLNVYLRALSQVSAQSYQRWERRQQLAFLINAYNAWTVAFILTAYPDIESIKDLGSFFSSPWKKAFIPLLGQTLSLDDIEQDLIRAHFNEPRIHFALNCASIGCPALRAQAYTAERLEQQLSLATQQFLSDSSRNRLKGNELQISKIFDWYQSDFEQGQSLEQFLIQYAGALNLNLQQQQALLKGEIVITYLDYNWNLNKVP